MNTPEVIVVGTGTANTASVLAALERAGARPRPSLDPADLARAEHAVLPGVGSFGEAMRSLVERGLVRPLGDRIARGKSTLCICLGLQVLFEASEESPGVPGLGIVPGRITRIAGALRVPQLGWNAVEPGAGAGLVEAGEAYFANSFRAASAPAGWRISRASYGGPLVAAMERGRVLACQFHPELSGDWGHRLIRRWLEGGAGPQPPATVALTERTHLPARVIPCLDVRDGRVVKGIRFENLRDAGDPAAQAARYVAEGADELVILDVSATREDRAHRLATVRAVRRVLPIPLTVGGGVRTADDAGRLLDAGADKVGINTAAFERPALIADIASRYGAQCAVLALDARRSGSAHEVVTHAGTRPTGADACLWARRAADSGAGEVLLTSVDRDGTGEGYDLDLLRAIGAAVRVPIIASGGASGPAHMAAAVEAGASAVLAASIFHDRVWTVAGAKRELARRGVSVRAAPTEENEP